MTLTDTTATDSAEAATSPQHHTLHLPTQLTLEFRKADPEHDAELVHSWLTHPSAHFWQMQHLSTSEVRDYLGYIAQDSDQQAWIGEESNSKNEGLSADRRPLVFVETYDPAIIQLQEVHAAAVGDLGMHLLIAPPPEDDRQRRAGLTSEIMRHVVNHCFELGAQRIVVEPDINHTAVRRKNREVGFEELRAVDLPEKRAMLSVLTADHLHHAHHLATGGSSTGQTGHLRPEHMQPVQRHLVAKAIAEFSHEKLLNPQPEGADNTADLPQQTSTTGEKPDGATSSWWVLEAPRDSQGNHNSVYRFYATRLPLDHWLIDEDSITRHCGPNTVGNTHADGAGAETAERPQLPLDAQIFIGEFQQDLGLPPELVDTYGEEIASTLASAAYKHRREGPSAAQLASGRPSMDMAAEFQHAEAAMTEGHPSFVATNGRIGFGLEDFYTYAPETGSRFTYQWVAAKRDKARLSLASDIEEDQHWQQELGEQTVAGFREQLSRQGLDPDEYVYLPVHPWQADHRLSISFAPDLANRQLVFLREAAAEERGAWQPQQSIRTAFDTEHPERAYVKTALSVQNMGFLRGLSPKYMRGTPAINEWVADQIRTDSRLNQLGFDVLREHAAIGYTGDAYHQVGRSDGVSSDQQKMLAALWRESPIPKTPSQQRLITMAALLHRDAAGDSVVTELIQASGLTAQEWMTTYLRAYLVPIIHCLEVHELAWMPHGENIILRLDGHHVVGAFMKDIGEEAAIIGERELPEEISRMRHVIDDAEMAQLIFTDVFDGVLRHLSGILHTDGMLTAEEFWRVVSEVVAEHENTGVEQGVRRRRQLDLRVPQYPQSCLNRLQLRNTRQMVDLQDASGSLIYSGELTNPLAR